MPARRSHRALRSDRAVRVARYSRTAQSPFHRLGTVLARFQRRRRRRVSGATVDRQSLAIVSLAKTRHRRRGEFAVRCEILLFRSGVRGPVIASSGAPQSQSRPDGSESPQKTSRLRRWPVPRRIRWRLAVWYFERSSGVGVPRC